MTIINPAKTLVSEPYPDLEAACRDLERGLSSSGGPPAPLLFAVWRDALGGYHFGLPHKLNQEFLALFHFAEQDGYSALTHMAEAATRYGRLLFDEIPGPDEGLMGLGLCAQAVRVKITGDETQEQIAKLMRDIESQAHFVFVHLTCRDGSTHTVEHEMEGDQDYFHSPTGETGIAGPMAVAVVKFLNEIVPEDVPIPDFDFGAPQGWWQAEGDA